MQQQQNNQPGQLVKVPEPAFENDLGESPLLFAHITQDMGIIAIAALAGGFGLTAWLGVPAAIVLGLITANDLIFCYRQEKATPDQPNQQATQDQQWQQVNAIAAGEAPRKFLPSANTQFGAIEVPAIAAGNVSNQQPAPNQQPATTQERIQALIAAMGQDGMPIQRLIKHPLLWAYGQSQSGKSTIINLVNVLRLGLGYSVSYGTLDDDVPPIDWNTLALEDSYIDFVETLTELLKCANKGSLEPESYTVDEFFKGSHLEGLNVGELVKQILGKGAKTKCKVSIISQLDTLDAHGGNLKGYREAIDMARVLIAPIRAEDAQGEPHPTGRYVVTFPGEEAQEWAIPQWMLTDFNQYGQPDPVVWVLNRFPELGRVANQPAVQKPNISPQQQKNQQAIASEFAMTRDELERLYRWQNEQQSQPRSEQPKLTEAQQKIVDFSRKNGWVKAIDVKRNVKFFKFISTEAIRDHFLTLESMGCGSTTGDGDAIQFRV